MGSMDGGGGFGAEEVAPPDLRCDFGTYSTRTGCAPDCVPGMGSPPAPAIAAGASGALVVFRKYTVCAVLKMLFANQYRVSPAGTFREKKPIIRGRYFKIACVCCWLGSTFCCSGCMIFCDALCDTTRSTGRIRYAMVSCHPSGGPPDEKSVSHLKPVPSVLDAMDAGPPRDGIQKNPSVNSPSAAAFDNARYKPMNTGRVAKVGRHPARGLKLASL
mmetsp:Transcript_1611/g.6085  ORF Transcript_1611/g.6085 Transcript_1611/m.6085 type:complete len:217 (-) Transcript_1611:707-1357(-)